MRRLMAVAGGFLVIAFLSGMVRSQDVGTVSHPIHTSGNQDIVTNSDTLTAVPVPQPNKLSELELLRLQVLAERQNRISSDYQVLYTRFLATPEVQALVKQSEATKQELQAKVGDTLHTHGLKPEDWQVSLETGEFVRQAPPAK